MAPVPTPTPKPKPGAVPIWAWGAAAAVGLLIGFVFLRPGSATAAAEQGRAGGAAEDGKGTDKEGGGVTVAIPPELLAALGLRSGTVGDSGFGGGSGAAEATSFFAPASVSDGGGATVTAEATAPASWLRETAGPPPPDPSWLNGVQGRPPGPRPTPPGGGPAGFTDAGNPAFSAAGGMLVAP